MKVRDFVDSYDFEIGSCFVIQSFNDDTSETITVYKSWENDEVLKSIVNNEVDYISIGRFDGTDCIVIEYTVWEE